MASFKSAFASARKAGKKEFSWNGKKYNTKLAADAPKPKAKPSAPTDTAPKPKAKPEAQGPKISKPIAANRKATATNLRAAKKQSDVAAKNRAKAGPSKKK